MDKKPLVTAATYFFFRDFVTIQLFAPGRKCVGADPFRVATFCLPHRLEVIEVIDSRRLIRCGVNLKPCNPSEQRFNSVASKWGFYVCVFGCTNDGVLAFSSGAEFPAPVRPR